MAQHRLYFPLTLFVYLLASPALQYSEAQCGLQDLNCPATEPCYLPPIADDMEQMSSGQFVWRADFFGDVNTTYVDSNSHNDYMTAVRGGDSYYGFRANAKTKTFVTTFNTREMIRSMRVVCKTGEYIPYHFRFILQDMNPPEFAKSEYTFNITTDWNPETPISDEEFVIVSDNAIEIKDDPEFLKFSTTNGAVLGKIEAIPLETDNPDPGVFFFRLNLFLNPDFEPNAGEVIQVELSANDGFNSAAVLINIDTIA